MDRMGQIRGIDCFVFMVWLERDGRCRLVLAMAFRVAGAFLPLLTKG